MADEAPVPRLRLDPTFNVGHLLTIATLIAGFASFLISGLGKVDSTARDVAGLQRTVAEQATSTREILRESVGRLEAAVGGLQDKMGTVATMAERVRQIEDSIRRLEQRDAEITRYLDERRGVLDGKFASLEQRAIESTADRRELRSALDLLQRASSVNLPGARGMR